jgi:SAM-dependent methyltransferase
MDDYRDSTYGDHIAEIYDDLYAEIPDDMLDFLQEYAKKGSVLELGIGTGRLAIPLAKCGMSISGIDASQAMVDQMRKKSGGEDIPVFIGDFTEVEAEGTFQLVFVVFNTFFALPSQADQVRCFTNVADRLDESGCFILEVFVPDLTRFDRGQTVRVIDLKPESVRLELTRYDPVAQQVTSSHLIVDGGQTRLYPVQLRFAWPAELDLMAQIAGMKLVARFGDWDKRPFTKESSRHISVYAKA